MSNVEWLTTQEVATLIGCSTSSLNQWAHRGKGPPYYQAYPGACRRYRRDEIEAWLEASRRSPAQQPAQG
jgi:excisionase family DNA binding protein